MKNPQLNNHYLLMRHGESTANVLGVISSHPSNAVFGAGLSAQGHRQVTERCERLRTEIQRESTVVYSSDFRRARESAELVARVLGLPDPTSFPLLRERGFGALEGLSTSFYPIVWAMDAVGATLPGIEAARSVAARMWGAIKLLEARHAQTTIVLVSHGDPIQMLLADKTLGSALRHRELPGVATAEIRLFPICKT